MRMREKLRKTLPVTLKFYWNGKLVRKEVKSVKWIIPYMRNLPD